MVSSVACGEEAEAIREEVIKRRQSSHRALVERFERAKSDGDLAPDADIDGLTGYIFAVMQGMAVQAGAGAKREDL